MISNKLSFQLEALSSCDNSTVITILYDNDVLIWDYKNNNKNQVKTRIINQTVPKERSKYLFKIGLSREINKDYFNCNLNGLLSFKSIKKLSN